MTTKKIKISDFYKSKNKKIFNIDSIDVDKTLVSKKVSYGKNNSFRHFIGYKYNDIIRPLFAKLPQMTSYINKSKDTKTKIDHYLQNFLKWLAILINLKIQKQK